MPPRGCVMKDCANAADKNARFSIHYSPKSGKLRNEWIQFVRTKRDNFDPSGRFGVCSIHFQKDKFRRRHHIEGTERRLVRGAVPTIWKRNSEVISRPDHRAVRGALVIC